MDKITKYSKTDLIEFKKTNWLLANDCFEQCVDSMFKILNNTSPSYMNNIFKIVGQHSAIAKSFRIFSKTNHGHDTLFYMSSNTWNNVPDS